MTTWKEKLLAKLSRFGICLLMVLLLELCFRPLGFLEQSPTAGPKHALLLLFGLLFGPAGALGYGAGILGAGILSGKLTLLICWEAICSTAVSAGFWVAWYLPRLARLPYFKRISTLIQYLLLMVLAALGLGVLVTLLPEARFDLAWPLAVFQVAGSVVVWSLLVGLPAHITATAVFAVNLCLPQHFLQRYSHSLRPQLQLTLSKAVGVRGLKEQLEVFSRAHQINEKQSYALLACAEELIVAVLEQLPAESAWLSLELQAGDSTTLCLHYGGAGYDPLAVKKNRGGVEKNTKILGILLVREMAASATYYYRGGINEVMIVL